MQNSPSLSNALIDATTRIGDRWTLLVVAALLNGPRRFNDLTDDVPGIATNVLAKRLRHLEHEGLVLARPYSTRPPRVDYHLTGVGQELAGALRLLTSWGSRHSDTTDPHRHSSCGTGMEPRWYCPTCETLVDDQTDEVRYF
jgi:DNA-binding HxlR family transcriptional regulator